MNEYEVRYNEWLNNPIIDEESKKELLSIRDNKEEIEGRICKTIHFPDYAMGKP